MPDIAMCEGNNCTKRESCYRYMATPDYYQSYARFESNCNEEVGYKYFWKMEGEE